MSLTSLQPKISEEKTGRMTFWSRHDPVLRNSGHTDHWAKTRQNTKNYSVQYGATGLQIRSDTNINFTANPQMSYNVNERPRQSFSRGYLRNSFNERAREGFRYWLIERPKPTKFGKYGIGSYKTVLGIGNAPRT